MFSINARYQGVVNVISRYRDFRENADNDDIPELLGTFEEVGGPKKWADLVRNRCRTSTRNGMLESEAVLEGAGVLDDHEIRNIQEIQNAALAGRLGEIEKAWRTVKDKGPAPPGATCPSVRDHAQNTGLPRKSSSDTQRL